MIVQYVIFTPDCLQVTFVSSERGNQLVYFLFCRSTNRAEESDEMSYMKELTSVSEPTQIQLGLL